MENDSFRLIVRRGPRPNEVYELGAIVLNLGRDITNDIVINDREVSRHHLRFTKGADGITMEDLGSTNGTFINGKRLTGATSLKNGDMVGLGETVTLQFEAGRPGAEAAPPVAQQPAPTPQPQNDVDAVYRPPAQQAPPQAPAQASPPPQPAVPQADPYGQQQAPQQYQPQQPAQAQQPSDAYAPPQDYYEGQGAAAASYGPPPPGYDYDPYAMREEEGGGTSQWLMIGCVGLLLLCCCLTVVAGVAIDCFVLWDDIPVLSNILEALAIPVNTTDPSCITF